MITEFAGKKPKIADDAYLSPETVVIGDVTIGSGSSIWFKSVIRGDINSISIGEQSNIQDGCLAHVTTQHPVVVGSRVTVGHGVILHGCNVGNDCLIGMGSILLDDVVVEDGCIVAAGSLLPPGMRVKAGSLVLGSPARVARQLNESDHAHIKEGWQHYVEYAATYRREIKS